MNVLQQRLAGGFSYDRMASYRLGLVLESARSTVLLIRFARYV